MTFWIICGAISVMVALSLLLAARRGAALARPAAEFDLQVYLDQLADVDRDAARGVLSDEDAERARTEIGRRVLSADAALTQSKDDAKASGSPLPMVILGGLAVCLVGGALWLYRDLGAQGYGDLPLKLRIEMAETARKDRPGQAAAQAEMPPFVAPEGIPEDTLALIQRLRQVATERPNDLQGQEFLARYEARLGNMIPAWEAQTRVIQIKGPSDASAEDFATLAEYLIRAAGGYVSPEAEAALAQALQRDPRNGVARYFSGLMATQIGRPDIAFRTWAALLKESDPEDPWVPPLRAQIEETAFLAGVDYDLPPLPELKGPSAEDIAAASDLSEADRMEMIRGMVAGLSDRLATEGGPPEEWARLISSLVVLGEGDRALLIYDEAKQVFAGDQSALDVLLATARRVGMPL